MTQQHNDPFVVPTPGSDGDATGRPVDAAAGPLPPPPPVWAASAAPPMWTPPPPAAAVRVRRFGDPEYDVEQPYHRVLRTRSFRWWRPLLGLAVGLVALVVLQVVISVATLLPSILAGQLTLPADPEAAVAELVSDPLGLLTLNLSLASLIPAAMLALLVGHQMRPGWLGSVAGRLRWGYLTQCLGVGGVLYVAYLVLNAVLATAAGETGDISATGSPQWALALVVLLTTPLQAAGEEYAFRGYLFQVIGSWLRHPVVPALLTAILFALLHSENGDPGLAGYLFFFSFGLIAAALTYLTGGLEAAVVMHVVHNTVSLLLVTLLGGSPASSLDATTIPWTYVLATIAWMAAYAAVVVWVARRRGLATRTMRSLWSSGPAPGLASSFARG